VHLPTPDWLDVSMAGYVEAAEAYFRGTVQRQSLAELAGRYRGLDVIAVLLVWHAETATGRPRFHPSLQAFAPDDPTYDPIFAACEEHGLLALFHTGTSGIGARQPGGQGIRIDFAHPLKLDAVAAAHPGWSPRRIPAEVIRELSGRLSGQFVWGSDFPFITPERCLAELDGLDLPGDVIDRVLRENATRILGLED
jgi:hypothetical protein